ncbi:hepatic lectin-like [Ruditapes philippinarum]|uniref:hepatic lectin-like n=1 Tax=Ruditapes philippinarum TaxID=129788 RepID=UPI00295B3792|nr:hepatic lectin-like [Ruditapes philippinarum]
MVKRSRRWIGASDYEVEGHYVWYGTGKHVTISDWQPGEPDGHDEDCLIYWGNFNWKWADGNCHYQYYFICEKPVENVIDVG